MGRTKKKPESDNRAAKLAAYYRSYLKTIVGRLNDMHVETARKIAECEDKVKAAGSDMRGPDELVGRIKEIRAERHHLNDEFVRLRARREELVEQVRQTRARASEWEASLLACAETIVDWIEPRMAAEVAREAPDDGWYSFFILGGKFSHVWPIGTTELQQLEDMLNLLHGLCVKIDGTRTDQGFLFKFMLVSED
jgi:hypothetical protein